MFCNWYHLSFYYYMSTKVINFGGESTLAVAPDLYLGCTFYCIDVITRSLFYYLVVDICEMMSFICIFSLCYSPAWIYDVYSTFSSFLNTAVKLSLEGNCYINWSPQYHRNYAVYMTFSSYNELFGFLTIPHTLRPMPFVFGPFEILPLLRNFFVIKYFPLTAMLNYLTYQVFYIAYIEKN